jgi:hypothetical protein
MLDALIAGERDPKVLAELALGRLRKKIPALAEALVGRFDDHHAFLARMICGHIDTISAMVAELTARIDSEIEPYRGEVEKVARFHSAERRFLPGRAVHNLPGVALEAACAASAQGRLRRRVVGRRTVAARLRLRHRAGDAIRSSRAGGPGGRRAGVSHFVGEPRVGDIDEEFDRRFLEELRKPDLGELLDRPNDELREADRGTGEVPAWVAIAGGDARADRSPRSRTNRSTSGSTSGSTVTPW